jgi:cytochrome bd-type quinol oxidase subunit 1
MAVHDYEQRKLAEIERQLAAESPRLVQRFAEFRPIATSTLIAAGLGLLFLLSTGLVIMVVGVQLGSPAPIALGALLTSLVPTAIGWFLRRHGRPPYR